MTEKDRIIKALREGPGEGQAAAEVASGLDLARDQRPRVRRLLKELVRSGVAEQQGRRFRLHPDPPVAPPPAVGQLRVIPRGRGGGRGLVVLDEGADEVVVYPEDLGGALDGDRVELSLAGRRRLTGRVLRVVARGRRRVTGVLEDGSPPTIACDDPRLPREIVVVRADVEAAEGAGGTPGRAWSREARRWARSHAGKVVLAEIVDYPEALGAPLRVAVTRALGDPGLVSTEVARVLLEREVVEVFPPPAVKQASAVPSHVRPADLVDRVDLRDRPFITIDPETARDFDDAVAIEPGHGSLTRVWVAVADVSHYVETGSPIDEEARQRSCSLYLPDRAVPMLPESLSSGICSLVPHKDRLAMVVRLDIDAAGQTVDSACFAAVIHSRGRFDYTGVGAALGGQLRRRHAHYREHVEQLQQLAEVAGRLRTRRLERGSLDLDLPEARVVLDEDDPTRVRDIATARSDPATRSAYNLIEELMIAANEAVGRLFERLDMPTLWRIHRPPRDEALQQLGEWLASYGIAAEFAESAGRRAASEGRTGASAEMQRVLKQLAKHPAGRPLTYLVLRSLEQARYAASHDGHFGLASPAYLHFTSPIRRYPDLVVHRLVKQWLRAEGQPAGHHHRAAPEVPPNLQLLRRIAAETSARERSAMEIERAVREIYAARLMRDLIGDEIEGTIVGLASFGAFVALDRPAVDGLVRFEGLDDRVRFDARRQRAYGGRTGQVLSLGDRVRVQVAGSNVTRRQVDLELIEHEATQGTHAGGQAKSVKGPSRHRPVRRRSGKK